MIIITTQAPPHEIYIIIANKGKYSNIELLGLRENNWIEDKLTLYTVDLKTG